MLITLCYVYMWVLFHKCYSVLIRNSLSRLRSRKSRLCLSFCSGSGSASTSCTAPPPGLSGAAPNSHNLTGPGDNVFLQLGDKAVYVTEPQACDDLSQWTVLTSSLIDAPWIDNISFIIEAAESKVGFASPATNKQVLKWSDYCFPLALSPGQPFRAVAQTTEENFTRLGVAFIEDRLQLDSGLVPSKIVPVLLQDGPLTKALDRRCLQIPHLLLSSLPKHFVSGSFSQLLPADQQNPQCRKGSLLIAPEVKRKLEERRGSEPLPSSQIVHQEYHHHHMEGHGHPLHLSSCHECLELENSTILSVKYASAENIPDLPDDHSVGPDSVEGCFSELEHDFKVSSGQSGGCSTAPNVLVYTGGCQERFQAIRKLLSDCINVENNIIYPLLQEQALNDPWLDNTRLLVLAEEEPLTPELQTRFLTYLCNGGKVLGLGSTLCPAGLHLEVREGQSLQRRRLIFTREDSTELEATILTSGKVYIRDPREGGEVELWGELKGDVPHPREMVIVRLTHGADGGEAVLCQVYFDIASHSNNLNSSDFDELKVSNELRYKILTEILNSLGVNCEARPTPAPGPVYLLATSQERKASFLKVLQKRADEDGIIRFSKASFRMVASTDPCEGPVVPEDCLSLITESEDTKQFMETYCKHLRTKELGNTVLYAEVATSTMDLLEGLLLHLPKDVGMISVASQQTQGKGRGRNAWLSPLGCAMFTVGVRVELDSRLGQRIPFLQHLAALAVVEAVCTLPGYQDINLRVKWPNDIYYSNLMKLGGVLVTSTVVGSTFHLLIGCGFNVTNSNPTVCINDLIHQYNRQNHCSLEPLSCSQLIALTLNCLEDLIHSFQHKGPDAVLPTYYKRWLHSGTLVRLWSEEGPEAQVVGLDDNGFLQVYNKEEGVISVEPDGNSFDMLKNLVVRKRN
ncbi:PREDICTED: biotin--protein ligase isoform X1 [Cyprinodon variegatus]|uniref:Holocarboxylase synthetase n=1 Tax=Cyprinodon variegatus TaxID=28743 RepID=A0A3Q2CW05_CYPVA|nr:PREDICTED: biotin--protein ligase isoform X1 [Cyprinodon variegatus]